MRVCREPGPRPAQKRPRRVGRYLIYERIASGGMASVYFGQQQAGTSFFRAVAIKELHPEFEQNPDFASMLLDEARIAARIQHRNVTVPLDVVIREKTGEIFLVMEYVHGETLSRLLRNAIRLQLGAPPDVVAGILVGALHGLHAAHEARNEEGEPLHVIHRDISPQNIMVGADGVPRILDFGIAKAASRPSSTRPGCIMGKFSYMAPEQIPPGIMDRRTDLFAAGVVLWEALTGRRLFANDDLGSVVTSILHAPIQPPSQLNPAVPTSVDRVLARALERAPADRYQTALEFAEDLGSALEAAPTTAIGAWVSRAAAQTLAARTEILRRIEAASAPAETWVGETGLTPSRSRPILTGAGRGGSQVATIAAAPDVLASDALGPPPGEMVASGARARRYPQAGRALTAIALAVLVGGPLFVWRVWLAGGPSGNPPSAFRTLAPVPAGRSWAPVILAIAPRASAAGPTAKTIGLDDEESPPHGSTTPPAREEEVRRDAGAEAEAEVRVHPIPATLGQRKGTDRRGLRSGNDSSATRLRVATTSSRRSPRRASANGEAAVKLSVPPAPPPERTGGPSCLPPYTVDSAGIRRVKVGCL